MPFVRIFYGQPSQNLREDAEGTVHTARGPPHALALLFKPARGSGTAHSRMRAGETLRDVYSVDRVGDVYQVVEQELYRHSRIRIHTAQVWNSAGVRPERVTR